MVKETASTKAGARKASARPRARRAVGWRTWLVAIVALFPLVLLGSHRVFGQALGPHYSVSVPIDFQPYDPAMWSLVNARDFASARAMAGDLPDPSAVASVGDTAPTAAPANLEALRLQSYVGPTATPYVFRGLTATDTVRAHYCLTAAIYYEAASESDDGMRGVAQVVLNRVRHPSFPASVCGVVFQGSDRPIVCQFTFACDGAMARAPTREGWLRASRIASEALAGRVFAPVGLATHYHTQAVWPSWGKTLVMTNIVGAHIFHRWRGRFGELPAFSRPYAGREPPPGPYLAIAAQLAARAGQPNPLLPPEPVPSLAPVGTVVVTPMPGQQAGFSTQDAAVAALPTTPAAPAPSYADPRLAQSGTVREEYRNSGSNITR